MVRLLAGRELRRFSKERRIAMISKVQVERFSLTSSKSFDEVLAAINDAVGLLEISSPGANWRTQSRKP
jgi:hypothetical protein